MKWIFTLCACLTIMTSAITLTIAAENKGPSQMSLEGGSRGKVPFPHLKHQTALKQNCTVCHSVFPQKKGGIQAMIKKGSLKGRDVMNKQCIACHKKMKKAGSPSGPTTCSKCHVRS